MIHSPMRRRQSGHSQPCRFFLHVALGLCLAHGHVLSAPSASPLSTIPRVDVHTHLDTLKQIDEMLKDADILKEQHQVSLAAWINLQPFLPVGTPPPLTPEFFNTVEQKYKGRILSCIAGYNVPAGPLYVHPTDPRYLANDGERVVHPVGSPSFTTGQPSGALVPAIASDWFRIVEYPQNHLNDFCLFRDQSGLWHAIGIMGTGDAKSELRFFHSTGQSLRRRFTNREPLFDGLPTWIGEPRSSNMSLRKHAPIVIYHEDEYHMFYRRPNGTNLHVRTRDPLRWPNRVELAFEQQDARDSCIIRVGEVFYHYSCQAMEIDGIWRSCVAVRMSRDLRDWSDAEPAHIDTSHVTDHSHMESPFVVKRPEGYYLFVRNRMFDYPSLTTIYFSQTPQRFPSGNKAWFAELENVHAPEIVEEAGRYFIARVSGPRHANRQAPEQGGGWIEVAELVFRSSSSFGTEGKQGAVLDNKP